MPDALRKDKGQGNQYRSSKNGQKVNKPRSMAKVAFRTISQRAELPSLLLANRGESREACIAKLRMTESRVPT
jgi:hypothetical protein